MKKPDAFWSYSETELLKLLESSLEGLTTLEAKQRLFQNKRAKSNSPLKNDFILFFRQFKNPLVLLLVFAVVLSFSAGTYLDGSIIFSILFTSGLLGFVQERRASKAAAALKAMIQSKATVKRNNVLCEVDIEQVVPGDLIILEAGDIVPADGLILTSKDLYINESALSGESFPSEKNAGIVNVDASLIERKNSVFMGTSVISGTATILAVSTGLESEFGKIEKEAGNISQPTAFETGIQRFGYLLMRIALLMSGIILIVNITLGRPALDSVLFALALSIGITPELLPAILTVTLAAGAKQLAAKKVIVKKLSSIQNLGSIDVLCSDKTGTLTEGEVKIHACLNALGENSDLTAKYAYINSSFETGYNNPLDTAIVAQLKSDISNYKKFDEVPYDFIRKRLSIVVSENDKHLMISKGSLKTILETCTTIVKKDGSLDGIASYKSQIEKLFVDYSAKGYRVIGLSCKDVTNDPIITKDDETEMSFVGFVLLNDPPKADIKNVIDDLLAKKVKLKIITGDNTLIAKNIAMQLGIDADQIISGSEIQHMDDTTLAARTEDISIFAETEPAQKERIVRALQMKGHVVGYLGDGINDASALKMADVGISVNNAVDIAKESADVILLEKNLSVISDGIIEGRKTYINTMKYILISVCSNFGNMFSLAILSIISPLMPLLPAQILFINFLTDLPALAIVSDNVDVEFLQSPRKWDLKLIRNFMVVFGLESSIFDFITFYLLFAVFQLPIAGIRTGWFVESVVTEVLILLVIRTHRTFLTSAPGKALQISSLLVILITLIIPFLPLAAQLEFSPQSIPVLATMLAVAFTFALLAEVTKKAIFKKMNY